MTRPPTDATRGEELAGSGARLTTTVHPTAPPRAAPAVGLAGAAILFAASLVQAGNALVTGDLNLAYRTVPEAAAGVMLVGSVVALGQSGAVGDGPGARSGLILAALGWLSFAVAQILAQLWSEEVTMAFVVATLLLLVGMTVAGMAVLRRRVWTGWVRWLPLLCGLYLVAAVPLLGLAGAAGELAIAGWGVLWLVLGLLLVRRPRAHRG